MVILSELYYESRKIRDFILRPLIKLLAMAGMRPDQLSYLGIISMCFFIYFVQTDLIVAFYCIVAAVLMDGLDGGLARYLKIESERGKFTDTIIDNLGFTLFVIGLVWASLLSGVIGIVFAYLMLLEKVFVVITQKFNKKSDWLFAPAAGAFGMLSYGVFLIYLVAGANYFDHVFLLLSMILIVKAILDYLVIKRTVFEN